MRQAAWGGMIAWPLIFGPRAFILGWEHVGWFALVGPVCGILELTVIIPRYYPKKQRVNPPSEFERRFTEWLTRVCREDRPRASVIAFNVGLFETAEGYSAYLVGSEQFDPDDGDWACDAAFTPQERYFPVPASELPFRNASDVQEAAVHATKAFLESADGQQSYLASATAVTVGFDCGDLERVR